MLGTFPFLMIKIYTTAILNITTHPDAVRNALSIPTAAVETTVATSMVLALVETSAVTARVVKKHKDRIVVLVIIAIAAILKPSNAIIVATNSL